MGTWRIDAGYLLTYCNLCPILSEFAEDLMMMEAPNCRPDKAERLNVVSILEACLFK